MPIVLWTLIFCLSSPATSPSTQPGDSVDQLIARLSSDEWRERQSAEDALTQMGPAITARLRQLVDDAPTEETRQRAASAIARIQSADRIGPSLITLHLHDAHPREVFAEIARQAATDLQPYPAELWEQRPWPKVNLDIDAQPFWRVVRTMSEQCGIDLRQWTSDGQMRLMAGIPGAAAAGRWTISGPFLITLLRCSRSQVIDYAGNDLHSSSFFLTFAASPEPKLRVLRATYNAKLEEATDDHGNSLIPADELDEAATITPRLTGGGAAWQFTARLAYPNDIGGKITTLRGSARAVLQTRFADVEFPAILSASNVTRSIAGLALTVKHLKKVGEMYELSLSVTRDRASTANIGWDRMQQMLADIRLLDADERPLNRQNFASGGSEESVEVTATFIAADPTGARTASEPAKLVCRIPTETREVSIPFEFHDVPLPK